MNNFDKCREYMVVTMDGGKDHHIKLAGTTEEPYFCGKDVCETLGYENIQAALFKIVEPENKKELKYLGPNDPQKVQSNLDCTFLGINRPLTFNEGKAIYINEDGLRSLISGSRTHKNKTLFLTSGSLTHVVDSSTFSRSSKGTIWPLIWSLDGFKICGTL